MGLVGVLGLDRNGCVDPQLVTGGKPSRLEVEGCLVAVESNQGVTVWRSVAHGGMRYAAFVLGPLPPTTGNRYVDDVVVRLFSLPTIPLPQEHMSLAVRVTGKAHGVGPFLDQAIQALSILGTIKRYMHHQDHEFFLRHTLKVILNESQLTFPETTTVSTALPVCVVEPFHVVEHDEMYLAVVEGEIRRTVHPLKGLVGKVILLGLEVEIMVSNDVEPRDANQRNRSVQAAEEIELVEHDVTKSDTELGIGTHQLGHYVIGDIVDLRLVARLRVAEEDSPKLARFLLFVQRKVNRLGQGPGRLRAGVTRRGRSVRLVDVVEARQEMVVQRGHPTARLEHEEDDVVRRWQTPTPRGIGLHNVHAIGNCNFRNAFLAGIPRLVAVGVMVNDPGSEIGRRGG